MNSTKRKTGLKQPDTGNKQLVSALKSENLKLQKQIAKLQSQDISKGNRIKALEKELKKGATDFHFDGLARDLLNKVKG